MTKKFPVYQTHEEASCFNCGADLDGSYPHDSGNAHKHGKWVQDCPKCQMATWYDLKPASVVLECVGANRFKLHLTH